MKLWHGVCFCMMVLSVAGCSESDRTGKCFSLVSIAPTYTTTWCADNMKESECKTFEGATFFEGETCNVR